MALSLPQGHMKGAWWTRLDTGSWKQTIGRLLNEIQRIWICWKQCWKSHFACKGIGWYWIEVGTVSSSKALESWVSHMDSKYACVALLKEQTLALNPLHRLVNVCRMNSSQLPIGPEKFLERRGFNMVQHLLLPGESRSTRTLPGSPKIDHSGARKPTIFPMRRWSE